MKRSYWLCLLRIAALVAIAFSAALYLDYQSDSPTFCATDGCGRVKASSYSTLTLGSLPLPLPLVGLAGFASVLIASLIKPSRGRDRLLLGLALVGGLSGAALIWVQAAKVQDYCKLCLVVDGSAIVAAIAGLAWFRSKGSNDEPVRTWAWSTLAVMALVTPGLWISFAPPPPVPATIHAYYQPGKLNVVEFADYECPFCRDLHPRLKAIMKDYGDKVHFVRINVPLEMHIHARGAARAAICAENQGKLNEVADSLFTLEDLTMSSIRRKLLELGVNAEKFDACLADPKTDQRLDKEIAMFRDAGLKGLPTTFVNNLRVGGAQPDEVFRDVFEKASRDDGSGGVPAPAFAGIMLAIAFGIGFAGRVKPAGKRSQQRDSDDENSDDDESDA